MIGQSKSCIDLTFTDLPNLFIESGIHLSLHEQCHHQIIHGTLSVRNLTPPPFTRKLWFYDRANIPAIRKSVEMFCWQETFEEVPHPDEQVKALNEVLLNICSNFIPNKLKESRPLGQLDFPQHKKFLKKEKLCFQIICQERSTRRYA